MDFQDRRFLANMRQLDALYKLRPLGVAKVDDLEFHARQFQMLWVRVSTRQLEADSDVCAY